MCGTETACACSTETATTAATAADGDSRQVYQVAGMTCGGCAARVSKQLAEMPGVSDVQVDVATGAVTIIGRAPVDAAAVDAAVAAAGYRLVR